MDELKIWKGICDESTVYLDLRPDASGEMVTVVAKNAEGHQVAALLYIKKEGIQRAPSINGLLGFKMTHFGRIALIHDPIIEEFAKLKRGGCPHCGN